MRKQILKCIVVALLILVTAVPVFAAGSVSISLSSSKSSVSNGDTFDITVYASVDSCGSGGIDVSYNSGVFQMVSSKCLLSGTDISGSDVFAYENATGISGNAFRITFQVLSSAPIGSSGINVTFKADRITTSKSISITVACDHSYSNSCDTTCNACGAERSISHSWNSGEVIKGATCTAAGTRKLTCRVCGTTTTQTISKTAHKYDHGCDSSCNTCGATRSVSHEYTWKCNVSEHWLECTGCGETKEHGSHSLAQEISGNESGHGHLCSDCGLIPDSLQHSFQTDCDPVCADCGYTREVTHTYSDRWSFDPGGHWHGCISCGEKLEKYMHIPGDPATETTDQICTDCGFVLETAGNHVHVRTGEWLHDDAGHWFLCTCYAYTEVIPHTWDAGLVSVEEGVVRYLCTECGYEKTELYIPEPTLDNGPAEQEEIHIPRRYIMIFLGALGASLIANVVLVICLCVKSRKKKLYDF